MNGIDAGVFGDLRNKHGRFFPKGAIIFHEGDRSNHFYVILRGTVRITKKARLPNEEQTDDQELAVFGPGDFFGEIAAFAARPRSATATAVEDTSVLFFDSETAVYLVRSNPRFALGIIRTLCDRIVAMDSRLTTH